MRASPIWPGFSSYRPLLAPAALHRSDSGVKDSQPRGAQTLLLPRGPAASAAPEPRDPPLREGSARPGIHSPSPATPHRTVGEGATTLPLPGRRARSGGQGRDASPPPKTLREPGKKCWARLGPSPCSPPSQAWIPCRPAAGREEGGGSGHGCP